MTKQEHQAETREERRVRAGLSKSELARRAGIAPDTVRAILSGREGQATKVRAVDDVLDEVLAVQRQTKAQPAVTEEEGLVEYSVGGEDGGISIVVRGPIGNREELEESVLRLIEAMNRHPKKD